MKLLYSAAAAATIALVSSCTMENPLLKESSLPFGAPEFDKIKNSDYVPAFTKAIEEGKAEIDAITASAEEPGFENTVEALEYSGRTFNRVASIFYNLHTANTNDEMDAIAEEITPMVNDWAMYISLNSALFERIKAVYDKRDSLGLEPDQMKLLCDTYKGFTRNGALLSDEDKAVFSKWNEELSLLTLKFSKNVLAATNSYSLNITDSSIVNELPSFVREAAAEKASSKGQEGWTFDLSAPSYAPFMMYSSNRELKKQIYTAYNTRAVEGENSNVEVVKQIADLRIKIANILGYKTYADYAIEERMAKTPETVEIFLNKLLKPALPKAREEVAGIFAYASAHGFEGSRIEPWDFSYWSEKYREEKYAINDEQLKPYFKLENCIAAVFDLAGRLYGLKFEERPDIPGYQEDVKVYDVTDESGKHMALFYADFFPRENKKAGAWMTDYRGESIVDGVEQRPFISIVTNFTKPTASAPSLLTHDEFTTFLHEFGHALHGMLAEGRYGSQTGTSVARDFVELPSQIMENWAYEPEYLNTFARHYETGEALPEELIERIVAAKNYHAAYLHVRQLQFGILDMAWHTLTAAPSENSLEFEKKILDPIRTLPDVPGTSTCTSFSHIFSGGYSAGYYSYKWAEVLEADAFSLFKEKGIFNREVSSSFRENILSKGSTEDEAVLYRNFRGHDPEPEALLKKLGIID